MEIEREKVSFSQNELYFGGRGMGALENEQRPTRREGEGQNLGGMGGGGKDPNSGILSERTFWMSPSET